MSLCFDNLVYTYDNFVLKANLKLDAPGCYCLLAPSGMGKSTFLELIAGFLKPDAGHIRFGHDEWTACPVESRPVSYLFQQDNLFAHLTIEANLALTGLNKEAFPAALQAVGLDSSMMRRYPRELSGGQQQRVALARTLLLNRPVILLDEPFSALDVDTKTPIAALTRQLQAEHGWLMIAVSHDKDDVHRLDAKTLTIENHQVVLAS